MLRKFFANTRQPNGLGGKIMLSMMNMEHTPVTNWGFKHIKIDEKSDALDIGCGGGKTIARLLKICKKGTVTGFDYSKESVKKSIKYNQKAIDSGRCKVIEGNVIDMPFKKNQFDVVSAVETIYFWPEIQKAFKGVYKILKTGGKFIIINEASSTIGEKWEKRIDGMKVYRKDELVKLLENAGFTVEVVDDKIKGEWLTVVAAKN